ncbi:SseB family protein [Demetria terragena]|uniref:SseB family protein n=1 Tax=Demetria terragena TaxID=63959 RepID=UPI00037F781A|nr:SseB family protein [Demetria terragena]
MTEADSAGQSFGGRALTSTGFDRDTGEADPDLRAALVAGDDVRLMGAIVNARLLVPIVAAAQETDDAVGLTVEKSTDMAAVTLQAPDGERALPVFTGTDSLAAWDADARPTPVTAARAAQAAVSEQCDVMVVDVAGPRQVTLRPSMVWALAQQREWLPSASDPIVQRAVRAAVTPDERVLAASCEAADDVAAGSLRVVLTLRHGLDAEQIREIATAAGERLATDGEVRARIDAVTFSILSGPAAGV